MSGIVYTILWIERKHFALYTTIKDSSNAKVTRKRQLVGLPLVSGYPTFLFAQVVWAVSFIRFYELNANITHSIGISKKQNAKVIVSASLVGLPFVSGYPTFLFAKIVWAVSFIRFYELNANITHSIGISKKRNAKVMRKRQLSRTTVCKRLFDFFVCTNRMSGIVYTILWIERYRKYEKVSP